MFKTRTAQLIVSVSALIALTAGTSAFAASVETTVDKEKAVLGDRIELDVVLTGITGMDVLFPDKPENTGDFSFISSKDMTPKRAGKGNIGKTYVFGIYSTGTHVIPPVEIEYKAPAEIEWKKVSSSQVPVDVASVLKGDETDIRDIKDLAVLRSGSVWLWILAIVALLAVFSVWWVWAHVISVKGKDPEAIRKSAHEIAYEELEKLRSMELPNKGRIKEYYTHLSDIERRYLERRFSYRVPEMTTEEFLNHLKTVPEIPRENKELLKQFLTQCDMVKFAKYGPTPLEALDSFKLAGNIVDHTKVSEEETKEQEKDIA